MKIKHMKMRINHLMINQKKNRNLKSLVKNLLMTLLKGESRWL